MNKSAGILLYRKKNKRVEFFLVHPGGPFWAKKDAGAWSIPKGEYEEGEDPLAAARREFEEETGQTISGKFIALTPQRLKSGKQVMAWAVEGDIDEKKIRSNTFEMEWPPKSGRRQSFPEVDKGGWFDVETAKQKINERQAALIEDFLENYRLMNKEG
ncbi:MAG TPA: NUDIX domain-containing protein [Chitinophagaceae bacterium]|nr:NUDIX domain-containing protein [Chitinophagaceae bacterium]